MTNPLAPFEDDPADADVTGGSHPSPAPGDEDLTRVFSRLLAHDANTVLGPMSIAADSLLASSDTSAIEPAQVIADGCRRLGIILRRLIEPGAARGRQRVHLNALIANLVSTFRPLAAGRGKVLTRLEEPMGPVWVDPIDLERALLTLLLDDQGARDAARETTPDAGALVLSTSTARSPPDASSPPREGSWVLLEIEDSSGEAADPGCSVDEPTALEASTHRWRRALIRIRQAARSVGGDIEMTRIPRGGTRVRAWLPVSAYGPSTREPVEIRSRLQPALSEDVLHRAILSFPPFRIDRTNEILWRDGVELPLRAKPFTILRYLAEHPQRLVTQRELVEAIWGNVVTSDSLLRTHVRELRHVLGEGVIETINGRGYRFVMEVTQAPERTPVSRLRPPSSLASVSHAKSW